MIYYNLDYSLKCFPNKFKKFLENKLNQANIEKTVINEYDIGSYNNAKLIGISFPKCSCKKDRIHFILKKSPYYPKSMVINKNSLDGNKKCILKMLDNSYAVVKKAFSSGGNDVFIVNSFDDIKKSLKNDSYVLQKIIEPYLFLSRKFDFRLYILYIREGNNYTAYTLKNGFARLAINTYKKNSQDSFLTNVLTLTKDRKKKKKHLIFYDSIIDDIKKKENNDIEPLIIDCLKDIANNQLPFIIKHNSQYFQSKNTPKYQFWLVGADIILDKKLNPFVLELNGEPGLLSELSEHNTIMLNNIWDHMLSNWLENISNTCHESNYFIKLAEKN